MSGSQPFRWREPNPDLTILLESRTKNLLTQVNWHVLFYCTTKSASVTQIIRGFIEGLLRAAQRVLGSRMRRSGPWLRTAALDHSNDFISTKADKNYFTCEMLYDKQSLLYASWIQAVTFVSAYPSQWQLQLFLLQLCLNWTL